MTGVPHMVDSVFLALSVLTIGSAIVALEIRSLIYGSIALMITLSGVAGFFLLLDAPFVAMFQLSVYVGSIAVLILFTVMLVRRDLIFNKVEDKRRRYAGVALMIVLMLGIGTIIIGSGLKTMDTNSSAVDYKKIGEDFLTYYSPALIVMALILASSIIGAMTLARREDVINDQRAD